eukprot:CAMPEP_0168621630 /NCGR_PEP_ID=MMETSP0449_2-20121227/7805_1 /TAXON_ID=1082188 /ORGANISM="Strombidium rassoulzadegani, Strain ras09" /LENGTH=40 /DNA_ID= /DNA_START= /DNA_END= /DNA_ORIENTATION=
MKIMDKSRLFMLRSIEAAKMELKILSSIINPFVVNLEYAF